MGLILKKLIFLSIFFSIVIFGKAEKITTHFYAYVVSLENSDTRCESAVIVSKIDCLTLEVISKKAVSECTGIPTCIDISHKLNKLYIGMSISKNLIYSLDLHSLAVDDTLMVEWDKKINDIPYRIASMFVSPNGKKIYVTGLDTTYPVAVLNATDLTIIKKSAVPEFGYRNATKPLDERFMCTYQYWAGGKVVIIDTKTDKYTYEISNCFEKSELREMQVANKAIDLFLVKDRAMFFIKDTGFDYYRDITYDSLGKEISQNIKVLDTSTGEIVDSIPFPQEFMPDPSVFSGKELVNIDIIFKKFTNREDEFPVVMGYGEISVSPDEKYIFWPVGTNIQNSQISYLIVIDTNSKKIVKRIPIGTGGITNVVFGYE